MKERKKGEEDMEVYIVEIGNTVGAASCFIFLESSNTEGHEITIKVCDCLGVNLVQECGKAIKMYRLIMNPLCQWIGRV